MIRIGPYEVLGPLGRGGAGTVLRARGPDGREVAIKVLHSADPETLARFERERRLLASLGEGFVPLLDSGRCPQGPFLVMPLLSGGTLRDRMRAGPFAIEEAVALVGRLAAALGRAHAAGIVHRDLKPENVLFEATGTALVADLGLAKHFRADTPGASQSVALSKTGELRGTPAYMPAEQAAGAREVGPAADVFALGAILYELVTGQQAFPGETVIEVIERVQSGRVVRPSRLRADVPSWLEDCILTALAPAPAARYGDASAFARALAGRAPGRRSRAPAVTAALVLAVAAGGGALAFSRPQPVAPAPPPVAVVASSTPPSPAPRPPRKPALERLLEKSAWLVPELVLGDTDLVHAAPVIALGFTPDGRLLDAVDAAGGRTTWSVTDGSPVNEARGTAALSCAAYASDGYALLLGCEDGRVILWRPGDRTAILATRGPRAIAMALDRSRAAWVREDGAYVRADLATDRVSDPVPVSAGARAVGVGRELVIAGDAGRVARVRADGPHVEQPLKDAIQRVAVAKERVAYAAGREVWIEGAAGLEKLVSTKHPVTALAWTPARDALVLGLEDGSVVTAVTSPFGLVAAGHRHGGAVTGVAVSPDGRLAASGGADGAIHVFDPATGVEAVRREAHPATSVALRRDGTMAVVGGADGSLRAWDLGTRVERSLEGHAGRVRSVAISRNGRLLASAGDDRVVRVRELSSGRELHVLRGHKASVGAVVFSESGKKLMSADDAGELKVWDLGKAGPFEVWTVTEHQAPILALAYVVPHQVFVTGDARGEVRLLGGAQAQTLPPHERSVRCATAEGTRVVTGGDDGVLRVIDLELAAQVAGSVSHPAPVLAAELFPRAKLVLTGCRDGVVRCLVIPRPTEVGRIDLGADVPVALALSEDGRQGVIASARGALVRFSVPAN